MSVASNLTRVVFGRPPPVPDLETPTADLPVGPVQRRGMMSEVLAPVQMARLLRASPRLAWEPRGQGQLVIDVPGWRAPEVSMAPLRSYLRLLGYDSKSWGFGTNEGRPERDAEQLAEWVNDRASITSPVALVGWSLGGVVSREVARALPDKVSTVVTFGTPVIGGPTHTLGAKAFGEEECRRIAELIVQTERDDPIRIPMTSIYTRKDAVVDWRACIDRNSMNVSHAEVGSTHLGMGIDPDVWSIVARALDEHA